MRLHACDRPASVLPIPAALSEARCARVRRKRVTLICSSCADAFDTAAISDMILRIVIQARAADTALLIFAACCRRLLPLMLSYALFTSSDAHF